MTKKTQPGWVLAIGIAGIIMSLMGIYTGAVTIVMPKILEFQTGLLPVMMEQMAKVLPREAGQEGRFPAGSIKDIYKEMLSRFMGSKPWLGTWCLASGIALLLIAALYLFSSIMFLQLKNAGLVLMCFSLAISVLYSIVNAVVLLSTSSIFGFAVALGSIIAGTINGVLLLVIAFSDKEVFNKK